MEFQIDFFKKLIFPVNTLTNKKHKEMTLLEQFVKKMKEFMFLNEIGLFQILFELYFPRILVVEKNADYSFCDVFGNTTMCVPRDRDYKIDYDSARGTFYFFILRDTIGAAYYCKLTFLKVDILNQTIENVDEFARPEEMRIKCPLVTIEKIPLRGTRLAGDLALTRKKDGKRKIFKISHPLDFLGTSHTKDFVIVEYVGKNELINKHTLESIVLKDTYFHQKSSLNNETFLTNNLNTS